MQVVPQDDPRLSHVYQGVQQAEDGTCYRQGVFKDGSIAYVDATDHRKFELSKGSFEQNTLHVIVTELDGSKHRAGGAYQI